MKNRKGILLIIIVLAISLFTTACMKKVNEKIGTKIGEKVLEKALGEDVKIDTKDSSMSIGTKDGSLQIGSDLDWPTEKMKPLPEPKAEVVSVTDLGAQNHITVMLNFSNEKGSLEYLEKIKDLGYIEISVTESSGYYSFTGYKDDNSQITFASIGEGEGASIALTKDSEAAKEYFENPQEEIELDLTGVDMTDEVEWPKDQMDKIPELEGKIRNVTISKGYVFIELDYVKKQDAIGFIEKLKSLGFDKDSTEMTQKGYITYMSQNDKEYGVSINWSDNSANISYTKPE